MKFIMIISALMLLSGCATSLQHRADTTAGSGLSQDQPRNSSHRHAYDENAYLRRISYNH
ncbi:MAG: hypothetical protein CO187_00520 [Zetaproteobacteria bacterium CG_4_9_14_3_um_filter_53_7]|nr:MAG: hypothetical protein CO187_00520 [Zetaproteobacteria bacterium CG_4_9_14_3_um_filter_53_7]